MTSALSGCSAVVSPARCQAAMGRRASTARLHRRDGSPLQSHGISGGLHGEGLPVVAKEEGTTALQHNLASRENVR